MNAASAGDLPPEGEKLLAAAAEDFVAERARVVRELQEAGRDDDARVVSELRKPSLVVLAANRAARDRPQAARDAANAAERVRKAQLEGDADAYRAARADLERASELLAEVALAQLSRGKHATDAMRRRLADLLRAATADDDARALLLRGALVEELETPGFAPFEGATFGAAKQGDGGKSSGRDRREERRRAREQELREELERARDELRAAERAVKDAERGRDRAARAVASIEAKLDRL